MYHMNKSDDNVILDRKMEILQQYNILRLYKVLEIISDLVGRTEKNTNMRTTNLDREEFYKQITLTRKYCFVY